MAEMVNVKSLRNPDPDASHFTKCHRKAADARGTVGGVGFSGRESIMFRPEREWRRPCGAPARGKIASERRPDHVLKITRRAATRFYHRILSKQKRVISVAT